MDVLFDLDGTLCDSQLGITRCIRHGMAAVGHPLDEGEDLRWCIGPPLADSFATLLGVQKALAADALKYYRERYAEIGMFENEIYPGIAEMLEELRNAGHRLFVATSKPEVFAKQVIEHFGLGDVFRRVHGSGLDGSRCQKTELIRHVVDREAISTPEAAMVGDREHDIIGANANGLRSIGVLWGYGSRAELAVAGAGAIVESMPQLVPAISR